MQQRAVSCRRRLGHGGQRCDGFHPRSVFCVSLPVHLVACHEFIGKSLEHHRNCFEDLDSIYRQAIPTNHCPPVTSICAPPLEASSFGNGGKGVFLALSMAAAATAAAVAAARYGQSLNRWPSWLHCILLVPESRKDRMVTG
jgi:hypothetical protein